MAYSGTTAASSLRNPPRLVAGGALYGQPASSGLSTAPDSPNSQGGQIWMYVSTNLTTDVTASGFFTDGAKLGMRPGDWVMVTSFSSAGSTVHGSLHLVSVVNSTAGTASLNSTANAAYYIATTRASSI